MSGVSLQRGEGAQWSLRGDLTLATATAAHAAGIGAIGAAAPDSTLQIDCGGIADADSAGLAVLIEWCAVAARRGVRLRFTALPDRLQRLAQISEVDTLLATAA